MTVVEESDRIHVESQEWGLAMYIKYLGNDYSEHYRYEYVHFKKLLDKTPFDDRMILAAERLRSWNKARLDRINLASVWEERLNASAS